MKKFLFLLTLLVSTFATAQVQVDSLRFNYVSNEVNSIHQGVVDASPRTASKIIVKFSGNWPCEAMGAFEYACKLFEASMLNTLPIVVNAVWDESETSYYNAPTLSSCHIFYTNEYNYDQETIYGMDEYQISNLFETQRTNNKALNYLHYQYGDSNDYYKQIQEIDPNIPDVEICYYNYGNKITNNCDFSICDEIEVSKYDFVTVALRDLYKGFGIDCNMHFDSQSGLLCYDEYHRSYFDELIRSQLDYNYSYENITSGMMPLNSGICSSTNLTFNLYAPSIRDDYRSFNYFIPDNNYYPTQVMRYDFGRDCMIRNIPAFDKDFFSGYLNWHEDIYDGIEFIRSQDRHLPITVNMYDHTNLSTLLPPIESTTGDSVSNSRNQRIYLPEGLREYYLPDMLDIEDWNVFLLKKDGTIERNYSPNIFNFSITDCDLRSPIEAYARTYDGKLRAQILTLREEHNTSTVCPVDVLIEYLPQKIEMDFKQYMSLSSPNILRAKIGMRNLEGTERVEATLISGNNTTVYEVPDFKKGAFEVSFTRNNTTKLFLTAYNDQGSTVSDTITLHVGTSRPPIGDIVIGQNTISLDEQEGEDSGITQYSLIPVIETTNHNPTLYTSLDNNVIDITNLPEGHYIVNIMTSNDEQLSKLFYKKSNK